MITLKSENRSYSVNLPTSLKEITKDVLETITEGIEVPRYHALVALCFETKLLNLAIIEGGKNQTVKATVLLAKIHDEDLTKLGCGKIGDKIITDASSIERAIHFASGLSISNQAITSYIKSDINLTNNLAKGGNGTDRVVPIGLITDSKKDKANKVQDQSPVVVVVELKIMPVSSIYATLAPTRVINDPFKMKDLPDTVEA